MAGPTPRTRRRGRRATGTAPSVSPRRSAGQDGAEPRQGAQDFGRGRVRVDHQCRGTQDRPDLRRRDHEKTHGAAGRPEQEQVREATFHPQGPRGDRLSIPTFGLPAPSEGGVRPSTPLHLKTERGHAQGGHVREGLSSSHLCRRRSAATVDEVGSQRLKRSPGIIAEDPLMILDKSQHLPVSRDEIRWQVSATPGHSLNRLRGSR